MIATFLMVSRSSIIMQSLGEIELRVPAVGAKIWCLVFLSRSESGGPFARVGYNLNRYCVAVYGSILILFSSFFKRNCLFRCARQFSFSSLGGATIFAKLRSKIVKSPKFGNVCAPHFV